MSADGPTVAFQTRSNLIEGDDDVASAVYVRYLW